MYKKEFVAYLAEATGIPHFKMAPIVESICKNITDAIMIKGNLHFKNFGRFKLRKTTTTKVFNQKLNKFLPCKPKTIVAFKHDPNLRAMLQAADPSKASLPKKAKKKETENNA